jgi:Family of unknown function (DUF5335)
MKSWPLSPVRLNLQIANHGVRLCNAMAQTPKRIPPEEMQKEMIMAGFIERKNWKTFLDEFSKRNQLRATRLQVIGEIGAQEEEEYLPLIGVSFDTKGTAAGSIEIILGRESLADERHMEHLISGVQRIAPLVGITSLEDGLGFEDDEGGKTLLLFEQLPELPEATPETRDSESKRA